MKSTSSLSARRLAFHEMMARLGVGDLHPGGRVASDFLLAEMRKQGVRDVLEVGAGIGNTTARMMRLGFKVTSLEPNPIMNDLFAKRLRVGAGSSSFQEFEPPDRSYDAVLSESVFYGFDLRSSLAKAHRLVRPGGLFAFAELLWTEAADPDLVVSIHDQTKRAFGIAMVPRERVTSAVWANELASLGFSEVASLSVDSTGPRRERALRKAKLALGLILHPSLLPIFLTYRSRQMVSWAPSAWLENRVAVWRRN
jgi:SAM-dependent methyltransferase